MATVHSIGTAGRNYSTWQAWEDAVPSTPTGGYIGECYNDSEFTGDLMFSGHTTSATNFLRLTTAAGQSFMDHATATTNPQFYDQSKGVGAKNSSSVPIIRISEDWVYVEKLQLCKTGGAVAGAHLLRIDSGSDRFVSNCIMGRTYGGTGAIVRFSNGTMTNCLMYQTVSAAGGMGLLQNGGTVNNCAVLNLGSLGNGNIGHSSGGGITENSAYFGWDTLEIGPGGGASSSVLSYCATDAASGFSGTNNVYSLSFAAQYESTTDFRLKAGNSMAAGTRAAAYTNDLDIVGQARSLTTPCIGQWEFIGSSPIFEDIDLATETDTALAMGRAKAKAIGLAQETDSALALTHTRAKSVGLASEADTALPMGKAKTKPIGLAAETDTALALTHARSLAIGLAEEADSALALAHTKSKALGLATETDTALAIGKAKTHAIGLATETDAALGLSHSRSRAIGLATETDTAQALTHTRALAIGLATETDEALPMTEGTGQSQLIGLAQETDSALPLAHTKSKAMGLATETDTALPLAAAKTRAIGLATETDTARAFTHTKALGIGLAIETDEALPVTRDVVVIIPPAARTVTRAPDPIVTAGVVEPPVSEGGSSGGWAKRPKRLKGLPRLSWTPEHQKPRPVQMLQIVATVARTRTRAPDPTVSTGVSIQATVARTRNVTPDPTITAVPWPPLNEDEELVLLALLDFEKRRRRA